MVEVKFDPQGAIDAYTRAFRRLQELPGFDPKTALIAEAGVILKTWAGRTKVAKPADLEIRARRRALYILGLTNGDITINAGSRGTPGLVWHRSSTTRSFGRAKRKFSLVGRMNPRTHRFTSEWKHFRDDDWRDITTAITRAEEKINVESKRAAQSSGLARQSVIQIADDLGIDLSKVKGGGTLSAAGIAKARAAIASNGSAYKNGMGRSGGDQAKSFVELINRLPFGVKAGMDRTLAGVIAGRAKFIETSYERGAFDSFSGVARAFPEILRLRGAVPAA